MQFNVPAANGSSLLRRLAKAGAEISDAARAKFSSLSCSSSKGSVHSPNGELLANTRRSNEYNRRSSPSEKIVSPQSTNSFSLVNDSGVSLGEDFLDLEDQKSAERDIILKLRQESAVMKTLHAEQIADMEGKLNRALRGTTYGDVSSETMLILFEKSLSGKRVISEEDYKEWEEWKANKKLALAIEDVNRELDQGLSSLLDTYEGE